jgi:glucokinase
MSLLAFDLGGTKLAVAVFSEEGRMLQREVVAVEGRSGSDVGKLISGRISSFPDGITIRSVGISVPGIYHSKSGRVWAPNIAGWEDYPLLAEVKAAAGTLPVTIDSDRACYILGELWQGNARQCGDAIFLAVGTGIGAGILAGGQVLRGSRDIAGAVGWMALQKPFDDKYTRCGCFEYYGSGTGIAGLARDLVKEQAGYKGVLSNLRPEDIASKDVFKALESGDEIAVKVAGLCVAFWGMACANLVSLFNPEKIIFGGGVFGPAVSLIGEIRAEASRWAQPVSMKQVSFEPSALGGDAGVTGAGFLALQNIQP